VKVRRSKAEGEVLRRKKLNEIFNEVDQPEIKGKNRQDVAPVQE